MNWIKVLLFSIPLQCFLLFNSSAQEFHLGNNASIKKLYDAAKVEYNAFEKTHGNYIKTKHVNMHYLTWGDPSDPCLIWAHGSMNNGYELLGIADGLVRAGFFVIAIDYYGHGKTAIPDHEVSLYHVADDIKFLMDSLSIKKAFIGGFSRGGYVATAFYDAYPQSVSGLILEDGGSVSSNTYYHKLNSEQLNVASKNFVKTAKHSWDRTYKSEFEAYKSLYDPNEKGNQFPIMALLEENLAEKNWSIIYSRMMSLFHLESNEQFLNLTLRLTKVPLFAASMMLIEPKIIFRNLNVPVLILDPVSKNDPMPFEKENLRLKRLHPGWIDYVVYQDTEHNIHYEHPKRFSADVITFLKKSLH